MKFLLILSLLCTSLISEAASFTLKSASLDPKQEVPLKHVFDQMGCKGENVSPALSWEGAPKGTKSFIVTMFDPDAPTGSGWWHWTIFNIPAEVTKLEEGASKTDRMPKGAVEGRTDYGKSGYGGPCPPEGDKPHNYVFTVYAMDKESVDLNQDSPGAQVGFHARSGSLGKATFTIKYGRKKK